MKIQGTQQFGYILNIVPKLRVSKLVFIRFVECFGFRDKYIQFYRRKIYRNARMQVVEIENA